MVWTQRSIQDLLAYKAPDPNSKLPNVRDIIAPAKREILTTTPEDSKNERLRSVFDKYNVVDSMSNDLGKNGGNDYLAKAEEMYFRANQLHSKAAGIRATGANVKNPNKLGGKTAFTQGQSKYLMGGGAGRPVAQSNRLGSFIAAIASKESGGSYGAVNQSSGALGKYQIMPANFVGLGGWDVEAIGKNVSDSEFLRSPKIQEKIARYHLAKLYKQYGARGAASTWYSGSPTAWKSGKNSQGAYPSIHQYVLDIIRRMK